MTYYKLYYGHMAYLYPASDMSDKVLVIEGELGFRKKLAAALSGIAFDVAGVANYFEALWKLGEFKPDLIIMDEDLPLTNGWESCYQLRQTFGIPVILMGKNFEEVVWEKALEAGADFYLRMPFSTLELAARIKTVLRRYKKNEITHQARLSFPPLFGD